MKTFKEFLAEMAYSDTTRGYLDSRSKPYEFWLSGKYKAPLPFSAPMFNRIKEDNTDKKALHITNGSGMMSLFELQNSSKSLSVMTKIFKAQAPYLLKGIETSGGYIVELEGNMIMLGEEDIFTSSDSDGMRWMDLTFFEEQKRFTQKYVESIEKVLDTIRDDFNTEVSIIGKNLTNDIREFGERQKNGRLKWALQKTDNARESRLWGTKLLNLKNTLKEERELNKEISNEHLNLINAYDEEINKTLFQITKDLFDNAERFIKDNFEEFSNIFTQAEAGSYNEGVMNRFKIKKIHVDARLPFPNLKKKTENTVHIDFLNTNLKREIDSYGIPVVTHTDMASWNTLFDGYTWEMAGKRPALFMP
jgi:hypothetical protein